MTEVERAILRNQLALLRAEYISSAIPTAFAIQLRRRLRATERLLYDPSTSCQCPRVDGDMKWPTRFCVTDHGSKMVCEHCDRAI